MVDNISFELSDAYDAYFDKLTVTGQFNRKEINNLIFVDFIEDVVTSDMSHYITEDDKNIINKVLDCIRGNSCLFSFESKYHIDDILESKKIIYTNRTDHLGRQMLYGCSNKVL